MNAYSHQLFRRLQKVPKGEYLRIRDGLCRYMRWTLSKYYHKVTGETRLTYEDRVLIESFFGEKIFKND